jgi:hypothetical protein
MARETIKVSGEVPSRPRRLFKAWLSAKEHAAFTGQPAEVTPREGTRHAAWDGYIHGWTLTIDAGKRRFTQSWRTTEFAPSDPDSTVTVTISRSKVGARVEIAHADIPEGHGERYQKGWEDHYLAPLRSYFAALAGAEGKGSGVGRKKSRKKPDGGRKTQRDKGERKVAEVKTKGGKIKTKAAKIKPRDPEEHTGASDDRGSASERKKGPAKGKTKSPKAKSKSPKVKASRKAVEPEAKRSPPADEG